MSVRINEVLKFRLSIRDQSRRLNRYCTDVLIIFNSLYTNTRARENDNIPLNSFAMSVGYICSRSSFHGSITRRPTACQMSDQVSLTRFDFAPSLALLV